MSDGDGILGLNHAVLFVQDAEQSARFYEDVLGFVRISSFPGGVFLNAPGSSNDHDLGLFTIGGAGQPAEAQRRVGLYHLAWEVPTLGALAAMGSKLAEAGALIGASDHGTTKSLYARDPDGIEFEVMWEVPEEFIDPQRDGQRTEPLDLDAEIARFGTEASRHGRADNPG